VQIVDLLQSFHDRTIILYVLNAVVIFNLTMLFKLKTIKR
jgi:hypothetical protein